LKPSCGGKFAPLDFRIAFSPQRSGPGLAVLHRIDALKPREISVALFG
jgi:hypothetical protein